MDAKAFLSSFTKDVLTGCFIWARRRDRDGYGRLTFKSEEVAAHRVAWILAHGHIPRGLHVLHRCDNPPCVNPDHLFLGTHADNMADMMAKGRYVQCKPNLRKTHCPQGHAYDLANTYLDHKGGRSCRTCSLARSAARTIARKAARS